MITKTVHHYRNFDEENFGQLLTSQNRHNFDISVDPDVQWEIIYQCSMEISSVMTVLIRKSKPARILPLGLPRKYMLLFGIKKTCQLIQNNTKF